VLIPRLLPPPVAGVLAVNCAYLIEADRIWSLKQVGAVGPAEVERLFARAGHARARALAAIRDAP